MKRQLAERVGISRETSLANRNVSMSNQIIQAAHSLTLSEKRIVSAALAQLDSITKVPATKPIRITGLEFSECFQIDDSTAYGQLKDGSQSLFKRSISRAFEGPSGRKIEKIRWVDRIAYHDGEGYVEISFTAHVAPHLTMLGKQFTTYKLRQASALRSIHSWRLFENLQQWESTGRWIVNIEDFHHTMEATPSYRKNFAQLRKWVIEPAVRELQTNANLQIKWKPVKMGRRVGRLIFEFTPNRQMALDLD